MSLPWEELVYSFMNKIVEHKCTSKEGLISLWNDVKLNKENAEQKDKTCPFTITRGKKMGEACGSSLKAGMKFCMKHTKDKPKDDEKEPSMPSPVIKPMEAKDKRMEIEHDSRDTKEVKDTRESKDKKKEEVMTNSHRMELEMKKKEEVKKTLVVEIVNDHSVVKGTNVIIQHNKIIGYLNEKEVCYETSAEVEKVSKEYGLVINRSQWKSIIDEISI